MVADRLAWLFVTEMLLILMEPPSRKIPPVSAKRPLGAAALVWLPVTVGSGRDLDCAPRGRGCDRGRDLAEWAPARAHGQGGG